MNARDFYTPSRSNYAMGAEVMVPADMEEEQYDKQPTNQQAPYSHFVPSSATYATPHSGVPIPEEVSVEYSTNYAMAVPAQPRTLRSSVSRTAPFSLPSLSKSKPELLLQDQRKDLEELGFPRGLALQLGETRSLFPVRYWILDNSGSMMANDGATVRSGKSVPCTRWAELQETVLYHSQLAGILQASTIYRMLNDPGVRVGPQEFSIANEGRNVHEETQTIRHIMQHCKPSGSTPLTQHLVEITQKVALMEGQMRSKGLEAVVVIATDGLPTSSEGYTSPEISQAFVDALQQLQGLPVWVVIRLCTNEEDVVEFYNQLDNVLELPLEVLDDFFNEAKEIQKQNRWLNYALPLHRCRELGYQNRVFDLLDERPLNKDEVKEYCTILFGESAMANCPDVHNDWNRFVAHVQKVLKTEKLHFNPLTKRMSPWIDTAQLKKAFGGGVLGMFKRR